jgi:hypothetical protein
MLRVLRSRRLSRWQCDNSTDRPRRSRQVARPFGRSPEREEAVIRARFGIYQALPTRKVETMRPAAAIVNETLAALSPANQSPSPPSGGDIRVL